VADITPENGRPVLSQTAEYALRTAIYMAEHGDAEPYRVTALAEALRIPQNYLSKTMHTLARSGVLTSSRGKHGGFRLARPAHQIPLLEVIRPFDQLEARRQCLLGRPTCSDATPCAAHARWKDLADRTTSFFRDTTLADITTPERRPVGLKRRGA
jgi:Rrf2 family protein